MQYGAHRAALHSAGSVTRICTITRALKVASTQMGAQGSVKAPLDVTPLKGSKIFSSFYTVADCRPLARVTFRLDCEGTGSSLSCRRQWNLMMAPQPGFDVALRLREAGVISPDPALLGRNWMSGSPPPPPRRAFSWWGRAPQTPKVQPGIVGIWIQGLSRGGLAWGRLLKSYVFS